jgi:DNA-binding XRE family transcriptional regulator
MSDEEMTPEQLKLSRERLNLTQQGMADAVGMSERSITYCESGVLPVKKTLKYAICWLLLPKKIRSRHLPKFLR